MTHPFILGELAQQRHAELLKEAQTERLLREAGVVKPAPSALKILVAVCLAAPFVAVLVHVAAAAAGVGGGGGGGFVHLMM
jgi:hypothetical protein